MAITYGVDDRVFWPFMRVEELCFPVKPPLPRIDWPISIAWRNYVGHRNPNLQHPLGINNETVFAKPLPFIELFKKHYGLD